MQRFLVTLRVLGLLALGACSIDNVTFKQFDASGDAVVTHDTPPTTVTMVVSVTELTVTETAQNTFTVALSNAPASAVLVNLASSNDVKLGVSPSALLFSPTDFASPRTITVTGKKDADAGDELVGIDVVASGIPSTTVAVTVKDIDGLAIVTTPSTGVDVTEGSTASLAVHLSAQPATPMTVTLASGNPLAASLAPSMLTFTTSNWNVDQAVTVTGLEDANTTNDVSNVALTGAGLAPVSVAVTVYDNDVLGIEPSSTNLGSLGEGTTSSFTVHLSQMPAANVTVAVVSNNPAAVAVTQPSLTFTPGNWNVPQTVDVTMPQDPDATNDTATISLTATGLTTRFVAVAVTDDDVQAITSTPNPLAILEGTSSTLNVRLAFKPAANVIVAVSSLDPNVATVTPSALTFTPTNYATTQPVTVAALEDPDAAPGLGAVRLESIATNLVTNVPVNVTDNDTLAIELSSPTVSLTEGGLSSFQVRLTAMPSADVTVAINSGDTSAATVSPAALTFTTMNWNTFQTVTVNGVEDVDLAAETVTLTASATGMTPKTVVATISDNDMQQLILSATTLTVQEGSSVNLGVSLAFQPPGNVTVTVGSNNTLGAAVAPGTLTFTPANFAVPQTVAVSGVQDANTTNESALLTVATAGALDATVNVNVTDDDVLAIQSDVTNVSVNEGGTATFQVRLSAQPAATTTVMLATNNASAVTVSPSSLMFTTGNFNTYQTVTVSGVEDANTTDETAAIILSSTGLGNVNVGIGVVDNDTLSIITTTGAVSLGEAGTAAFGVHLSAMPVSGVTVTCTSADTGAATVSPATLTFSTANYGSDQSITVAGVADNDVANESVAITCSATGLANRVVTAVVIDDDTQEVLVNGVNSAPVNVGEGATTTFAVTLRYIPSANVAVTIVSNNTSAATVSTAMLTFTPGSYSTAQNVTITGVQDANATNESTTITASAPSAVTGTINLTVADDDVQAILLSTTSLMVPETTTGTFKVHLGAQPAADTVVSITSPRPGAVSVSPSSMTFTTSTWNIDQAVTVSGVNDADQAHESVAVSVASAPLATKQVTVAVADDDLLNVPATFAMCELKTVPFNIGLATPFTSPQAVTIAAGTNLTVSPTTLSFAAAGNQNVNITAGGVGGSIQTSSLNVTGPLLAPRPVTVTIRPASHPACAPPPVCGDGTCAAPENASSCPADCPAVCGDGYCSPTENFNSCPTDCPDTTCPFVPSLLPIIQPCCGDGTCSTMEYNNCTCPQDCGTACPF